jgi:DNA-binding NarL/FixJ family response regulator
MVGPVLLSPGSQAFASRTTIRLLLCDDQALFRAGMKAVLSAHSRMEVVGEAEDGRQALAAAERLRPAVVLMDAELPGLDGIEATRHLLRIRPEIKVVILTASREGQRVSRCVEAGACGYVLKSAPVAELTYAIEAVAGGGRYLSPAAEARFVEYSEIPGSHARTGYDLLTEREREVLRLLADGLSVKEVAARLDRSVKTAEVHKYNLMRKLGVHHQTALVKYAIAHGIVEVPLPELRS